MVVVVNIAFCPPSPHAVSVYTGVIKRLRQLCPSDVKTHWLNLPGDGCSSLYLTVCRVHVVNQQLMNASLGHSASCLITPVCWLVTSRDERTPMNDAPRLAAEVRRLPKRPGSAVWLSKGDCLTQLVCWTITRTPLSEMTLFNLHQNNYKDKIINNASVTMNLFITVLPLSVFVHLFSTA